MSYKIEYSGKINKDVKLALKRGLNISLFKTVVEILEKVLFKHRIFNF